LRIEPDGFGEVGDGLLEIAFLGADAAPVAVMADSGLSRIASV
jgi:hypothetical protein